MKGGVRIVHARARNALVVIHNGRRPLKTPSICLACESLHHVKTYHVRVDDQGSAIVSHGVFEGLKAGGAFNERQFSVDAEVTNPPKQILGKGGEVIQRRSITLFGK